MLHYKIYYKNEKKIAKSMAVFSVMLLHKIAL